MCGADKNDQEPFRPMSNDLLEKGVWQIAHQICWPSVMSGLIITLIERTVESRAIEMSVLPE